MHKSKLYITHCLAVAATLFGCGSHGDKLRADYTPEQIAAAKAAAPKEVEAFEAMSADEKSEFLAKGGPRKLYGTLNAAGDSALRKRFQSDMANVPMPELRHRDLKERAMEQDQAARRR